MDGNTVYVGNHKGEVYALDINNGSARWKFQCDGSILGSVAVDKDKVYVGTFAGRVYALNRSSGLVAWSTKVDGPVMAGVTVTGDTVYAGCNEGSFYAINSKNGQHKWQMKAHRGFKVFQPLQKDLFSLEVLVAVSTLWILRMAVNVGEAIRRVL